ncbi:MAG TPA: class I SAM-dependent methyltransferase [Allosphingosinicella sp.]|nr:class I SAM-dependent methyltransferase [Allosphingosinicella sp.]
MGISDWDQYWHYDRIASCFDDAGSTNYEDVVAAGWRGFFGSLPAGAAILDLCTGNGALPLIASQVSRNEGRDFAITGVDYAAIDPEKYVARLAEQLKAIAFLGGVRAEQLPFAAASFDAVVSQYGIEYTDLPRSLAEARRVIRPAGQVRLVMHAAEGAVAKGAKRQIEDADFLLETVDLPGAAQRCFEAVTAVERSPAASAGERDAAAASVAAFTAALERAAGYVAAATDPRMVRNSGEVLLDTYRRRRHFDRDQLTAKVDEVRGAILAHRGRVTALRDAAVSRAEAAGVASRLVSFGAGEARSFALARRGELIGHVVEARF